MYLLYLDESGDTFDALGAKATNEGMPLFVLGGIAIDQSALTDLTRKLVEIKARALSDRSLIHRHDYEGENAPEIKGSLVRHAFRSEASSLATSLFQNFLDEICDVLKTQNAKLFAQISLKRKGQQFTGEALYGRSMELIFDRFQAYLNTVDNEGIVIADSRDPGRNSKTAHSIYKKKFRAQSEKFPAIVEAPVFGHSENHAGIQIADFVCSSLLAPMAAIQFASDLSSDSWSDEGFKRLVDRYGPRLQAMQRWPVGEVENQGFGVGVSDLKATPLSTKQLFRS